MPLGHVSNKFEGCVVLSPQQNYVMFLLVTLTLQYVHTSTSIYLIEFSTARVIKGAALADFMAEWAEASGLEAGEDRSLSPGSEAPDRRGQSRRRRKVTFWTLGAERMWSPRAPSSALSRTPRRTLQRLQARVGGVGNMP